MRDLVPLVFVSLLSASIAQVQGHIGTCSNNEGICLPRGSCRGRGGIYNGYCQYYYGYGDCCACVWTIKETCSRLRTQVYVNQMVTILESPATATTECSFRFRKENNICQIRLDFTRFESIGANEDGNCDQDSLRISNSLTVKDLVTCGSLTGQHMYLTFGPQHTIDITPALVSAASRYRIVATKIPCNSDLRAPDYCLQYFTGGVGQVKSFDFGPNGQQQNNQRYMACVKPLLNSEKIEWRPCTGMKNALDISSNRISVDAMDSLNFECKNDWIQLKGENKKCLNLTQETTAWKPYELLVNFDEAELPPPPTPKPVDPANCEATCSVTELDCMCDGVDPGNQACLCIKPPGSAVPVIDVDNTGFCLEFTQM